MSAKERVPAVEGWFADGPEPHLWGNRCRVCGSYFFPRAAGFCRNPNCEGDEFDDVPLSRRGTVWSYSTNHYRPPEPYVSPEPFEPYSVVAVELAEERMVVLGQLDGDPAALRVGADAELTVAPLYEDDEHEYVVWKWRIV